MTCRVGFLIALAQFSRYKAKFHFAGLKGTGVKDGIKGGTFLENIDDLKIFGQIIIRVLEDIRSSLINVERFLGTSEMNFGWQFTVAQLVLNNGPPNCWVLGIHTCRVVMTLTSVRTPKFE